MLMAELFWPYIGGIEVITLCLARALKGRGHQVMVATSHGSLELPDSDTFEGIPIRRFPFTQALAEKRMDLFEVAYRGLLTLRKEFAPEVVHQTIGPAMLFHLRAQARQRVPSVLSFTNGWEEADLQEQALVTRALLEFDHVIAVSDAVREDIVRIAPVALEHTSVIYNAVDWPSLAPAPLHFEPAKLLCLGRISSEKGFDVALRAFARLAPQYPLLRLQIAGDGPARPPLEVLSRDLGVGDRVDFSGWIQPEDVPAVMNTATVFVMPSRWREAFGIVTLQAMQMARPVVATAVGGSPELVEEGVTGYLVPNEDDAAVADRIAKLLADPGRAESFGAAGRERARLRFSLEQLLSQHEQLYSELIRKGKCYSCLQN
jgi:glycogen synthase